MNSIDPCGPVMNSIDPCKEDKVRYCQQCGKDMGNEWILGAVCGKCCKTNHKRATKRK